MIGDPIIQEVRKAREAYAARFNYDLAAIVADLQRRTEEARRAGRQVVSRQPKPIETPTTRTNLQTEGDQPLPGR